jgi:hypothetical protein
MHPSPDSPPVAHFFWCGDPLSLWTRACVSAFVRHGFDVRLHSIGALGVPAGVAPHDADVYCLKPAVEFVADHRNVAGWESTRSVASGVLKLGPATAERLFDQAMKIGAGASPGGDVGPRLVTRW